MILDVVLQFLVELLRALLVDELSGHVRRRLRRSLTRRGAADCRRVILGIHRRTRDRLLHKLFTARLSRNQTMMAFPVPV
jgi:hypothetical protein